MLYFQRLNLIYICTASFFAHIFITDHYDAENIDGLRVNRENILCFEESYFIRF
jgi:hypothetical protein